MMDSDDTISASSHLMDSLEISILEAEKRANPVLNIRDFFTAYLIETKLKDDEDRSKTFPRISLIWRRYSEFEQFQQYLQGQYPHVVIPPLPEKKHLYTWRNQSNVIHDNTDPDFVDRRRAGLENFLHRIASHSVLSQDVIFKDFLTKEFGWNDSLKQEGYIHLVESKLKDLAVLSRSSSMDPKFQQIAHYSKQLENNLDCILKARLKLVEETYVIDTLHTHIGRLFSEWSVIEKCMGDGLQQAGHFIDSVASSTEAALQEEDVIADQFKEYLFYASSIDAVYKHHLHLQLQIENLRAAAKFKSEEKERIQQGKTTLMGRLFGAVQTPEVRNEKIAMLEKSLADDETRIADYEVSLKNFSELALQDFSRFQKQKDLDIQETLSSYVVEQIKAARRGLNTWTNIKHCIQTIP